eukprot:7138527-Prymnesium_polylepis.1
MPGVGSSVRAYPRDVARRPIQRPPHMRHRLMCVLRADGTRHAVCVTGLRGPGRREQGAGTRKRRNSATRDRVCFHSIACGVGWMLRLARSR